MEEKELDLDLDFRDLIYDYENRVSRVQEIKARRIKNSFTPPLLWWGWFAQKGRKRKNSNRF